MTMLQKFHQAGRLMKTPVQNVTMTPKKGVRWALADVIQAMSQDDQPQGFDDLDAETKAAIAADLKRFNMHAHNTEGQTQAGVKADAVTLLEMAKLLESDAQSKREQAYRMDPTLRPQNKHVHTDPTPEITSSSELEVTPVTTRVKRMTKKVVTTPVTN
jgi:hypothetical protein